MKSSSKRKPEPAGVPPKDLPAMVRDLINHAEPASRVYARRPASRRDRVLAQWRGVDLRSLEDTARPTSRAAGSIVGGVLGRLRLDQRQAETEIVKVWNHLIDPNLTAHAQPAGINKGTLFVNVDSSPWLDEIVRYRRKEILQRLQTAFGHELIKRISFRIG